MAKETKILYDGSDDESEMEYVHDSDNDNENNDDEPTKEQLYDLMQQTRDIAIVKDKECKKLSMKVAILENVFSELKTTHESLVEDHEDLGKAHSMLEKAHSLLLEQQAKKEVVVSCDIGVTCDIINESSYEPIIISNANPSCSSSSTTTDSTSTTSDGFTCDASLMVENETLKKEMDELTHALGKAYGGEARLLKCLSSQRFSLNKEGLGYTPKKGKSAFATPKPSFVKGNGRFCNRCKKLVNAISFDSCYVLTKSVKGMQAKFIGTPIVGPKKKAIWVPKSLVTNLQGPKQKWVPKLHLFACRSITKPEKGIRLLIVGALNT
jgi:hypothetical protein